MTQNLRHLTIAAGVAGLAMIAATSFGAKPAAPPAGFVPQVESTETLSAIALNVGDDFYLKAEHIDNELVVIVDGEFQLVIQNPGMYEIPNVGTAGDHAVLFLGLNGAANTLPLKNPSSFRWKFSKLPAGAPQYGNTVLLKHSDGQLDRALTKVWTLKITTS